MPDPLTINSRVFVPVRAISVRAARSGGPGGQNVNKVATKVELRIDLAQIEGLTGPQRERLAIRARLRLDADGHLLIVSQRTRDQSRNLDDARERARQLIAAALPAPKRRVPTRPSRGAKERRLSAKKQQGERKRQRRWAPDD